MAYSMTAYGRATSSNAGKNYLVEIKSVNNRFFDCTVKTPSLYGFLEEKTKAFLMSNGITRGKVNVFINIDQYEDTDTELILNESYANQYLKALDLLAEKFNLQKDVSLMRIASNRDLFIVKKQDEDTEKIWNDFLPVLKEALNSFLQITSF